MTKIVCLPGGLTTNWPRSQPACRRGSRDPRSLGWLDDPEITVPNHPEKKILLREAPGIYIFKCKYMVYIDIKGIYTTFKPFRFLYLLDRDHTSIENKLRNYAKSRSKKQHGLVDVQWTAGALGR